MTKKLFTLFCTVLMTVLIFSSYDPLASAAGNFGPKQLTPQLSSDGKMLYNGIPTAVYVVDPNPPKNQVNIPSPLKLRTSANKLIATPEKATASFSITYISSGNTDTWGHSCTTFPDTAKTALNAAAAIWGNLVQSTVPITITACWSGSLDSGTLGQTGGEAIIRDFPSAPLAHTWYVQSLANALSGSDLHPSTSDMYMTFSSTYPWYLGTDGATPSGKYDFMSVALHEITHGLNFMGSMDYASGTGSWGSSGYPFIYDTFMNDAASDPSNLLITTSAYPNPSTALGTALSSNSIWFHGTNAMAANGGSRVKIYAPSPWSDGSSYSHLDYDTFKVTVNRLMVYAISSGVSTHDPGPVVLGMLQDMGWPISASDVTITMVDSPHTLLLGNNITYTITVAKDGAGAATSVNVIDDLPAGLTYVSATPSQGSCSGTSTVTCNLDTISNGNSATIIIIVTPTVNGIFNNTATLSSSPSPTITNHADTSTTVNNHVPSISSLSPSWTAPGGSAFLLTVNGTNFVSNSKVQWNSADIINPTTFVSSTQLTVTIPAEDIATAGSASVTVVNPAPGGGHTSALTFTISNTPPASGGGGGGGCFIATAAFGSPMERHVQILRDFRDRILLNSSAGKAFVDFYYRTSPAIADKIAQSEGLRFLARMVLMPIIGVAYLIMYLGMFMTLLILAAVVFTGFLSIIIWRRKIGKVAGVKAAA